MREAIYWRVNKPHLNRDQGRTRLGLTCGTHYCSHACRSLKDLDRVTVVIVIKALVRAESSVFIVEKVYRVSKVKSIQVVISSPVQMSLLSKNC